MRWTPVLSLLVSAALAAPALASMGGGGSKEPEPTSTSSSPTTSASAEATPRQQAERLYGDAYDEIAKAKKDLDDKKDKNAEKKFKKALDRAQQAVVIDSTYHEAWNLIGYSQRKLKHYDEAVAAYQKCLSIQFDYAPAREYLGEAYLEMGKVADARAQLAVLEKLKAPESVTELKTAIDGYVAAHPEAAQADAATAAAPAGAAGSTAAAPATQAAQAPAQVPAQADSAGSKP